jgi:hypothetical protein
MSDMLKKLTKKIAPVAGRSCDIGLATSRRSVANGGYLFITHQRKQEFKNNAKLIIFKPIPELTISHRISIGQGGFNFSQQAKEDLSSRGFGFSPQAKEDKDAEVETKIINDDCILMRFSMQHAGI